MISCGVTGKMVFEQMLTILFATGVGVAVVLYVAKPRTVSHSAFVQSSTAIETIASVESATVQTATTAPMPEVTAIQAPVVEPSFDAQTTTSSEIVPTVTAQVAAAAGPSEIVSTIDASAVAPSAATTVVGAAVEPSPETAGRTPKTPRRRSTASRAKPSRPRKQPQLQQQPPASSSDVSSS